MCFADSIIKPWRIFHGYELSLFKNENNPFGLAGLFLEYLTLVDTNDKIYWAILGS